MEFDLTIHTCRLIKNKKIIKYLINKAFAMFVGEALCIFLYFYKVKFHQVKIQDTDNTTESRLSANDDE